MNVCRKKIIILFLIINLTLLCKLDDHMKLKLSYPIASNLLSAAENCSNCNPTTTSTSITITDLSPTESSVGETITITGTNFIPDVNQNKIVFTNGVSATPTSATATEIKVVVPNSAKTGTIQITNTNGTATTPILTLFQSYLYVANFSGSSLRKYKINSQTGVLTDLGSETNGLSAPRSLITDTNGKYLYAGNYSNSTISLYTIDANSGNLSFVSSVSITSATNTRSIAIDNSGSYIYALSDDATKSVVRFTINQSDGTLSNETLCVTGLASGYHLAINKKLQKLYFARSSQSIYGYDIQANGNLTALTGSPFDATTSTVKEIAIYPNGNYLYVATSGSAGVSLFAINQSTGILGSATVYGSSTFSLEGVEMDPKGRFLFAINNSVSSSFLSYKINSSDGSLNSLNTNTGYNFGISYAARVEPYGRYIVIASTSADRVESYSFDQNSGNLQGTAISNFATGINDPYNLIIAKVFQN